MIYHLPPGYSAKEIAKGSNYYDESPFIEIYHMIAYRNDGDYVHEGEHQPQCWKQETRLLHSELTSVLHTLKSGAKDEFGATEAWYRAYPISDGASEKKEHRKQGPNKKVKRSTAWFAGKIGTSGALAAYCAEPNKTRINLVPSRRRAMRAGNEA